MTDPHYTAEDHSAAASLGVDLNLIEEVAFRLDLREPNWQALDSLMFELAQYYTVDLREPPFECVLDSATGVGKTYIAAAAMEVMAAIGMRNFAVITPGRTILDKTVANFTPGHRKSLLPSMNASPVVVTAENFDSAATRTAMDDDTKVKIYVFTVQSLLKPTTTMGRKTHDFQEGLGAGFYQHLAAQDDLMIFADEHHVYFGPAFSKAIRDLAPRAIVGLTATPHPKTPEDQIIHRYPLAAAIADQFVKAPVIVGRRDDRSDPQTKLADGVTLLRFKEQRLNAYCYEQGLPPVRPVMLVVAQTTAEADEYEAILESSTFEQGAWAGTVLKVHSNLNGEKKEAALQALDEVEEPDSKVRIIISVGMLKEGWDVKNVYVIASMRASVSKVLTEQTLGRGLRLPFGRYTGIELLDTVEVLAHERYEQLLRSAGVVLNEQFVDLRTRSVLRRDAQGRAVVVSETATVHLPVVHEPEDPASPSLGPGSSVVGAAAAASVKAYDERTGSADQQTTGFGESREYVPLDEMPLIMLPEVKTTKVESHFKLADITEHEPFRQLGRKVAADPDSELLRKKIGARVVVGIDGLRRTELVTTTAVDSIEAAQETLPLDTVRSRLVDALLASPAVPARADQAKQAGPIIDAFIDGLGDAADRLLSAYGDRAAARLVGLVTDLHRQHASAPTFEEVIDLRPIGKTRTSQRKVDMNPTGPFARDLAYDSYVKSLYGVDWFHSATERSLANLADGDRHVRCWVRLQTGDLPIRWRDAGNGYNPDLIVVDGDDTHWLVEVKADDQVTNETVQAKKEAARKWVNYVNASDDVTVPWRYILVTETDIKQAKGSWVALTGLGA